MVESYQQQAAGGGAGLSNKIMISLSCRNLADLDTFSKSDPEVHVYLKGSRAQ
jgi:hypothetical protein